MHAVVAGGKIVVSLLKSATTVGNLAGLDQTDLGMANTVDNRRHWAIHQLWCRIKEILVAGNLLMREVYVYGQVLYTSIYSYIQLCIVKKTRLMSNMTKAICRKKRKNESSRRIGFELSELLHALTPHDAYRHWRRG